MCQFAFRADVLQGLYGPMSFGFVFILPVVLGALALIFTSPENQRSWWYRICGPWISITAALVCSVLLGWEGAICLIAAGLVYYPLGSLGGIFAGWWMTRLHSRSLNSVALALLLLLPPGAVILESLEELPLEYRGAETDIVISASPEIVWKNISRVRPITEPVSGFFYRLGFPKPIEATLSHEGLGGIRIASFERGLVFIETITTWNQNRELAFSITADPTSIPATTLDEHVVVGGRYFDVLRGEYRIEPIDDGHVRLHLSSRIRISTRFNFYAGFWGTVFMADIQRSILRVIKDRA